MEIKYLIVAEFEDEGFLIEIVDDIIQAIKNIKELMEFSTKYDFAEQYKIKQHLNYFEAYKIFGNQEIVTNAKSIITNGSYSLYVVEINSRDFDAKIFVKERQNN